MRLSRESTPTGSRLLTCWRTLCASGVLFALSLSLYLYVPLASMTNPPMNWGYARTADGFWHTLTRGQYERPQPTTSLERFGIQFWQYLRQTGKDLGPHYLVPALASIGFMRQTRVPGRGWLLGLLVAFISMAALTVAGLNSTADRGSVDLAAQYFLSSHLVLILWSGCGLILVGNWVVQNQPRFPRAPQGH